MTEKETMGARFAKHAPASRVLGLCGKLLRQVYQCCTNIIESGHAHTILTSLQQQTRHHKAFFFFWGGGGANAPPKLFLPQTSYFATELKWGKY
jgi:hypothetical protein